MSAVSSLLALTLTAWGAPPVRVFTTEDGLVRNWVHRIQRDTQGLLWFCTNEGVSIFDGKSFTNFTTRDGLPDRAVMDFLHARDGSYWLATGSGVTRFHPRARSGGHFELFPTAGPIGSASVHSLQEDAAGNLWVGTRHGVYVWKKGTALRPEPVIPPMAAGDTILSIALDRRDRLWIGTEATLFLRHPDGRMAQVGREKGIRLVRALMEDRHGRIWAGGITLTEIDADGGALVFREHPEVDEHFRKGVHALQEDEGGHLWVGGFGLRRFHPEKKDLMDLSSAIPSGLTAIGTIATDLAGNVWTNFNTVGAQRITRGPVEQFAESGGKRLQYIAGFFPTRSGGVIAVSDSPRRLFAFDGHAMQAHEITPPQAMASEWGWGIGTIALQDRAREWWFASARGVLRYPAGDTPRHLGTAPPRMYSTRDGLPGEVVLQLFEDSRGGIWAGCFAGLARWDRGTGQWTPINLAEAGVETLPVQTFAEDASGAVWAGFSSPLLIRVRNGRAEKVDLGIRRGAITALLHDAKGRLWVGTTRNGMALIANPREASPSTVFYGAANGLSSDHVHSLSMDKAGRIYVSNGRGVDRFDPRTGRSRLISGRSGLPAGEVQVSLASPDGSIWFGSPAGGLARYSPGLDGEEAPPPPAFRTVAVNGVAQTISALGEAAYRNLQLAPGQDTIAILYRAAHFSPEARLRYQWRLDGEWSEPSNQESVQLVGLRPGSHRFEVRTVSEPGQMSVPALLEFELAAPLWQRWWVLTLAGCGVLGALYWLHLYRVGHLLMVERVRARLATDLHDDLGAGLAEISILSELARQRRQDDAALEQVGHRARSLRASLSDIVWAVDPRRDRLSDLVDRMRDAAYRLLQSEDCRVHFRAPPQEELREIEVRPELRRHLLLFFKEAVTNVARHARATKVWLEIDAQGREWTIEVRDNGVGFSVHAPSSGYGLMSLRNRASEVGGILEIDSTPGRGTAVRLRIPSKAALGTRR